MIQYIGFGKRFGTVVAADGIDLRIAEGETLGLIGPNGSGKTTTLKALVGLIRPTAGRVMVGGVDVATAGREVRGLIGYLPQRLALPDGVTARAALRLCAKLRGTPRDEVETLLERVELSAAADRVVDGFSGGMRQRLGLAAALLGRPRALAFDEPSAALDPTGALLVRDLLIEARIRSTTVILSSHDLAEVSALADRIAVFSAGRVLAIGTLSELLGITGGRSLEDVYRGLTGLAPIRRVA
ncbi:MAG TPA: ABC transporter ATP-binding protein [Gemmatimonadales bacterium]|nr:ABC transporter ATP-binding protein [Gemmatimonadales bacterium]